MSTLIPVRSFNRSQGKIRIGGKALNAVTSTYVNVDSPRVRRDLGKHSAIGAIHEVGAPIIQADAGHVVSGGIVATRATTLVVDVGAVGWVTTAGVAGSSAAGTATVTTADGTNPRIDIVVVDTSSGAYSVIAGTPTAGAVITPQAPATATKFLGGLAAVTANKVALAYILVPATATTLLATNVVDVRP